MILLSFTLNDLEKVEPIPPSSVQPYIGLKAIPSIEENARHEVLQLTAVPLEEVKTKEIYRGKGQFELNSARFDPLGRIAVNKIMSAQLIKHDFQMKYGKIIFDYLAEEKNRDGRDQEINPRNTLQ